MKQNVVAIRCKFSDVIILDLIMVSVGSVLLYANSKMLSSQHLLLMIRIDHQSGN